MRYASFVAILALSIALGGCHSRERTARAAFETYQAAAATGNLRDTRNALLALVAADEGVFDYWVELGKVQAALGSYSDAYYALTRAHELNRADLSVLQAMTQLALRGGNLQLAEQHAKELELISPDDPAVQLTYAYVALRRGNTDDADRHAETLLAKNPYDSSANVLKARVLLRDGKGDAALALLAKQVDRQPADVAGIRTLLSIADRRDDWPTVVRYSNLLLQQAPDDAAARRALIEASLHAKQIEGARAATLAALKPDSPTALIDDLMGLWRHLAPPTAFTGDALRLAEEAGNAQKIAYTDFLDRVGDHADAARITQDYARLPINASNTDPNAVYSSAIGQMGQMDEAKSRLDAVIAFDGANAGALRARAEWNLRSGQYRQAIEDAQKLVAARPDDGDARILLSRCFTASGDPRNAERALWDAFHDIPANRNVYEALRLYLAGTSDPDSLTRLATEYNDQRDTQMTREFL